MRCVPIRRNGCLLRHLAFRLHCHLDYEGPLALPAVRQIPLPPPDHVRTTLSMPLVPLAYNRRMQPMQVPLDVWFVPYDHPSLVSIVQPTSNLYETRWPLVHGIHVRIPFRGMRYGYGSGSVWQFIGSAVVRTTEPRCDHPSRTLIAWRTMVDDSAKRFAASSVISSTTTLAPVAPSHA